MTRTQTEKKANELLNKMRGPGWKIEIWHSKQWNYQVRNGGLTVYPQGNDRYGSNLALDDSLANTQLTIGVRSFNTPMEAVYAQLKKSQEAVNMYQATVQRLVTSMGRY